MRRRFMFASALASLTVLAPAAMADREVNDEINTPLTTSTAGDGGVADNIVISVTGRVVLTSSTTAVTIDSDNTVENSGEISITTDDDDAVGVHLVGGNTGGLTNAGRININSDTTATDTDDDGNLDGPLGLGSNRVAILVDGAAVFTGDILLTGSSSIVVRGDNSSGIRILSGLDGNLTHGGRTNLFGDNTRGIDIRSDISGDVVVGGTVTTDGVNSSAVVVEGDVAGRFVMTGTAISTGYRFGGIPTDAIIAEFDAGEDDGQSAAAVRVSGNIANGVLFVGPTDDLPDLTASNIRVRGSAPAVHFATTATSGDIVVGEVVIPAVADDPDTEADESVPQQNLGYAFVNRGSVVGSGEIPGVASTAVRVEGGHGFTTTLTGGIQNRGTMQSNAFETTSTAIAFGDGAIVPVFHNINEVAANANGIGGEAIGVLIEAGANMPSLINNQRMLANGFLGGSGVVIRDLSGTLTNIENMGVISAGHTDVGEGNQPAFFVHAADLSASTSDVTYRQYRHADDSDSKVILTFGDILFGSGNDQLLIETGTLTGAMSFGDGADTLAISGGADVNGDISDSDGDLVITVDNANLVIGSGTNTTIREARFGDGSTIRFEIDHENGIAARLDATGDVTFETGSRVSTTLTNLIGEGASYVVLTANNVVIEEAIASLQQTTAPYLYNAVLARDPNDANALVLSLSRRTAAELGMSANQSAAYAAAYAGWQDNADLGAAFAGLQTQQDFFNAYNQLLPEYAASAIQFALASNDSAIGALASRLEAVRRSPDESGGLWIQEFGYFADRGGSLFSQGYRGQGIGMAIGYDQPAGPFEAIGFNLVGAASEISEADGVDRPMSAMTAQFGVYAGSDIGGFNLDLYGGLGGDWFEHDRRVLIGTFDAQPSAEWTGYHVAGSARLGRDFQAGRYFFRPAVSVDYLSLFESSYEETGGGVGIDLLVDDRESSSFSATGMFTMGAVFDRPNSWWAPQVRFGYRSEFAGDEVETLARFNGYTDTFTLRSEQMPGSGFIFGFGVGAGSGYSTFSFAYDADVRDDFVRHTARLVMRLVF